MLYPRSMEFLPPARTIEQALDDLIDRLDALPSNHPEVPALREQVARAELLLLGR